MRLNKHQRNWIKKLKSGTTRKAKGVLNMRNGAKCCLGVGIEVCGVENLPTTGLERPRDIALSETLEYFPDTAKLLGITNEGRINISKVKQNWMHIMNQNSDWTLMMFNDETKLTHAEIGEFIDNNREAVFQ